MKKTLFVLALLFQMLYLQLDAQFWNRTNPGGGGWFMSVGAGPSGTILVASDLSGAYRSTDGGASWDVIGAASGLNTTHASTVGFDPIDGNILYIGTNRGIFRSSDGGNQMEHVLSFGNTSACAIGDIKFSKSNPSIGYASYQPKYNSLEGIIYKSTDRGLSWNQVSLDLPQDLRILKILVHPTDSNIVFLLSGMDRFACGPAEIYRSINGGENWTQLATEISDSMEIMDFAIDPSDRDIMYLTSMNVPCNSGVQYLGDIHKSTDGGESWFDPNTEIEHSGVIWINKEEPENIRLIDVRKTAPWIETSGTFHSEDGGVSWSQIGDEINWDAFYLQAVNDDLGSVIHRSYGSNRNFCRTLGEDLSDSDKLYWCNTRFVYGTEDGGVTFKNLFTQQNEAGGWTSTGVDNVVLYDIEVSEADPNLVFAGFADSGLWRSVDAGLSWQNCNKEEFTQGWGGYGGNSYCIAPDPEDPNKVWAVLRGTGANPCNLVKSLEAGEISSWNLSNTGLPYSELISDIAIDPNSNLEARTLYSVVNKDIYKSIDDGNTWSIVFSNGGIWFVEIDQFHSEIIYAGGASGFYISHDAGLNWNLTGHEEMSGSNNEIDFWRKNYAGISSIHPSKCIGGLIYVTVFGTDKGLYKSDNFGEDWIKINNGNHMRSVVASENQNETLFTGSSYLGYSGSFVVDDAKGLQISRDGGLTWFDGAAGLEFASITDLELNHAEVEKLFAVSQGTGIHWTYDLISPHTFYLDNDEDGFGDPNHTTQNCNESIPLNYVRNDEDCDDSDAEINPVAQERCNDYDDNCNGEFNEGLPTYLYYLDFDQDSFGDAEMSIDTCLEVAPDGYVDNLLDCDDSNASIYPAAMEIPNNNIDEDCDGEDLVSNTQDLELNRINIYPNPTHEKINIYMTSADISIVSILSATGKELFQQECNSSCRVDLSALASAVYLLKIVSTKGECSFDKIVKL